MERSLNNEWKENLKRFMFYFILPYLILEYVNEWIKYLTELILYYIIHPITG